MIPTLQTAVSGSSFPTTLTSVETIGGDGLTVLAVFVLLAIGSILSLLVTYRLAVGYRRTGSRPLLALAVGLFLLTAAPMFVRFAFANAIDAPTAYQTLLSSTSELLGLLVILRTIYQ